MPTVKRSKRTKRPDSFSQSYKKDQKYLSSLGIFGAAFYKIFIENHIYSEAVATRIDQDTADKVRYKFAIGVDPNVNKSVESRSTIFVYRKKDQNGAFKLECAIKKDDEWIHTNLARDSLGVENYKDIEKTLIPQECTFHLISDLLKGQQPEKNKIYLGKKQESLQYCNSLSDGIQTLRL